MKIKIDKLSYGGPGVGRVDGKVVFVDGGVPGDILNIKIIKEKGSYNRAVIEDIIAPSEERTEPECEFFAQCGGCNWQYINYKTQLREKREIVSDSLLRIGKLTDIEVDNITGSPNVYGYRNRVLLTVFKEDNEYKVGYFEEGSSKNVSINRCTIASDEINSVIQLLIKYFTQNVISLIPFEKIYLFSGDKKVSVSFLQTEKHYKSETEEIIQSIIDYLEENLQGIQLGHELEFELMGYEFISNSYVFNQTNNAINKSIIETVAGWIEPVKRKTLLDLYCGIGNYSITLSNYFDKIAGVDSNLESIKLAKRNLDLNNIANINFINNRCQNYLATLKEVPDVLLVDPPRNGIKNLIKYIDKIKPGNIIYISCNPTTLARDLKSLTESHYRLIKIKPFDMFPQTYHIEVASLLELI
ncbi:MAG: class I SAM-dependent RNA methyltransferase [Thermodesulfobacteriota bacterium]